MAGIFTIIPAIFVSNRINFFKLISTCMKMKAANLMERLLEKLEQFIEQNHDRCLFNTAAELQDIKRVEKNYGIKLPSFYKTFLLKYNGGFICDNYFAGRLSDPSVFETAAWNSNHIFGLWELQEKFEYLGDIHWKLYDDELTTYPFIPFCHTKTQELLIFVDAQVDRFESPVFDAFHEDFPSDWELVYPNFYSFLDAYIQTKGNVATMSKQNTEPAEYFLQLKRQEKYCLPENE